MAKSIAGPIGKMHPFLLPLRLPGLDRQRRIGSGTNYAHFLLQSAEAAAKAHDSKERPRLFGAISRSRRPCANLAMNERKLVRIATAVVKDGIASLSTGNHQSPHARRAVGYWCAIACAYQSCIPIHRSPPGDSRA